MKLIELKNLIDHDVYEFCYANNFPNCWNENSLFLSTEDFSNLSSYLDKIFPEYHYYGPQKITLAQWEEVKNLSSNPSLEDFFNKIDGWIKNDNQNSNYFWILGV